MKFKILSVGRSKHSFIAEGEAEYIKRLRPFAALEIIETEARTELPEERMKEEEAEALLKRVPERAVLVALDETGKAFSSREFADWLKKQSVSGSSEFCFVLGGASGLGEAVKKRSRLVLSLSPMTFTYQMARLLLVEQLYRATSLIRGTPYHK